MTTEATEKEADKNIYSEEHLRACDMNWSITIAIFSVDINFSFLN